MKTGVGVGFAVVIVWIVRDSTAGSTPGAQCE